MEGSDVRRPAMRRLSGRPRPRWLVLALVLVGAGSAFVGWKVAASGNGTTSSASALLVAGAPGSGGSPSVGALARARQASDGLPRRIAADAQKLREAGFPEMDTTASRLLLRSSAGDLYAWPAGGNGLCVAISLGATRCTAGVPRSVLLGFLSASTPEGGRFAAGVVGDDVVAVTITVAAASCSASVRNNGFVCILPAGAPSGAATVVAELRNGETERVRTSA